MRDVLDTSASGMVTLIALGPFTDIACLQRAFPASFNKLREIIGLVGSRDGKPVLQGMSFTVEPGQKVALVGPTGCGKSSCMALLQRLYAPISGEILIVIT